VKDGGQDDLVVWYAVSFNRIYPTFIRLTHVASKRATTPKAQIGTPNPGKYLIPLSGEALVSARRLARNFVLAAGVDVSP
jgi:hypothetical protein